MGILQEYRFYLIIAVIALAAIIFLFFRTQTQQGVADFGTELKSNYAQIKGQASETKSLYSVVTIDNKSFRGMKSNQMFGLTYQPEVNEDIAASRLLIEKDVDLTGLKSASENTFEVLFVAGDDVNGDSDYGDTFLGSAVNNSANDTPAARGWNLESGWDTLFVFRSPEIAKDVMVNYLPEGTLVGSTVSVPFLSN